MHVCVPPYDPCITRVYYIVSITIDKSLYIRASLSQRTQDTYEEYLLVIIKANKLMEDKPNTLIDLISFI